MHISWLQRKHPSLKGDQLQIPQGIHIEALTCGTEHSVYHLWSLRGLQNTSTHVLIPLDMDQAWCNCPWGVGPASVRMGSDPTDPAECACMVHKAVHSQQLQYSSNTSGLRPVTDFRQVDTIRPMDAPGALDRRLFAWDPTQQTLQSVPVLCTRQYTASSSNIRPTQAVSDL
jgi:hypothetical protein